MKPNIRKVFLGIFLFTFTIGLSLGLAEGVLRLKNSSMKNYDIEMWRYAKEVKFPSEDPELGHEHTPNTKATLQGVEIRTNDWGLRGGPVLPKEANRRDILFLGSSITLGWGVKEEEAVPGLIQTYFRKEGISAQTLNAGIGNYNSPRYVGRFFKRLKDLNPTDIVVQYFLRDAETLERGGGNWFLRNSQLAVTLWTAMGRIFNSHGENVLVDHYKRVYDKEAPGRIAMEQSLKALADYGKSRKIRLYLAMTPDVHNLKQYPFTYIHDLMQSTAEKLGYTYVDLMPALSGLSPEEVWSLPGDPHPNALGHQRMAEALYPTLKSENLPTKTNAL